MLALVAFLPGVNAAEQARLAKPVLNIEDNFVSSNTAVDLDVIKAGLAETWQPNMCFELKFASPYSDPSVYHPFSDDSSQGPSCTPVTVGLTVSCKLKDGSTDTL
jgi:hypothetical protein